MERSTDWVLGFLRDVSSVLDAAEDLMVAMKRLTELQLLPTQLHVLCRLSAAPGPGGLGVHITEDQHLTLTITGRH